MSILVDTNILCRLAEPKHEKYAVALAALDVLRAEEERLVVVPQVLYEFWVVCTRPATANGGLGLSATEAFVEQQQALGLFTLLPDTPEIFYRWQNLVVRLDVKGKPAHDARLVAAMRVHGVGEILTFNGSDFARYQGVRVRDPYEPR